MYLLDTNHCTYLIGRDPTAAQRLADVGDELVATSVIVQAELFFMAYRSQRVAENLYSVERFLDGITIYSIDEATAHQYGQLKAAVLSRYGPKDAARQRRTTISQIGFGENDLWIAATAVRHGLTVVSSDQDFVRIAAVTDLQFVSWKIQSSN